MTSVEAFLRRTGVEMLAWIDSDAAAKKINHHKTGFSWFRCLPFILIHLGAFGVIWVGANAIVVTAAIVLYFSRVFFLTAFYHRYFSHRTFKTNRFWQFIFAICGLTAIQRGPLWWAAHHRRHHLHADGEEDAHSPVVRGILWSHFGWFTCARNFRTYYNIIPDFTKYPELVFLNRFDWIVPVLFMSGIYASGAWLETNHPEYGVSGLQMLVWCGFLSTVAVYHATFCVNSLCHLLGTRPFKTEDHSRNNWLVALLTFGEGWHNNHHRFPGSARQGFVWWQIDISYYILRLMQFLRIIHDLKSVPQKVLLEMKNG